MTMRKTYLHALFTASHIFCTSFPTNYLKFWLETYSTVLLVFHGYFHMHNLCLNTHLPVIPPNHCGFCTTPLRNCQLTFFDCIKSLAVRILLPWKMNPLYYDTVLFFTSCTWLFFVAGLAAALLLRPTAPHLPLDAVFYSKARFVGLLWSAHVSKWKPNLGVIEISLNLATADLMI